MRSSVRAFEASVPDFDSRLRATRAELAATLGALGRHAEAIEATAPLLASYADEGAHAPARVLHVQARAEYALGELPTAFETWDRYVEARLVEEPDSRATILDEVVALYEGEAEKGSAGAVERLESWRARIADSD